MQKKYFQHKQAKLEGFCLLLTFIIPIAVAYCLYGLKHPLHFKTTENGALLSPPILATTLPFFKSDFLGKWQLIYVAPSADNHLKHPMPAHFLQINAALGKEKTKIDYQVVCSHTIPLLKEGQVAIMDPNGWLMMHYPPNTYPPKILKDIRRLLKKNHG